MSDAQEVKAKPRAVSGVVVVIAWKKASPSKRASGEASGIRQVRA